MRSAVNHSDAWRFCRALTVAVFLSLALVAWGFVPPASSAEVVAAAAGAGGDERGSVPPEVVGVWCGGSNSTPEGHWTYAFSATGEFVAKNANVGSISGYVVTSARTMTFHSAQLKAPVVSTWQVSPGTAVGDMLFLDGFSYVRGACGS
ncbi:hypothetical protein [Streptomyces sp. URMC 124]|uniref:hypothetical protein n=1 Tax=Streptomyces sp. URMC 124 TaxID=3423405 RepID=UPI003F1B9EE1